MAKREPLGVRVARWHVGNDTGLSSVFLASVMQGGSGGPNAWYPCDSSDFGRCERLLLLVPEWRKRLPEMGTLDAPAQRGAARVWGELAKAWWLIAEMFHAGDYDGVYAAIKACERKAGIR